MLEIILFLFLFAMLYISLKIYDYDLINPTVIYNATWVVCSFVYMIYSSYWKMPLHINTFLVIFVGNIIFNITIYIIIHKFKGSNKKINNNCFEISLWIKRLMLIYIVIFLIYAYIHEYNLAVQADSGIDWYNLPKILSAARAGTIHYNLHNSRLFVNGLRINYILSILFFYEYCLKFNIKNYHNNLLSLIISFLLLISTLLSGGRTILLGILTGYTIVALYLFFDRIIVTPKIIKKVILLLLLCFIIFIVLFGLMNVFLLERIDSNNFMEALNYTAKYIGSSIPDLDYFLNNRELYGESFFGASTFNSIWVTLSSMGLTSNVPIGEIKQFIPDTGTLTSNIYTVYFHYIYDFGYFSIPIFQIVNGMLFGGIYSKVKTNHQNNCLYLLIYALLVYPLIMMFFQENLWSMINTHIVRIFILFISYCFILKFDKIKVILKKLKLKNKN